VQQTARLFDHLVSAAEQRDRQGDAERLRGFKVDDELDLVRLSPTGRPEGLAPLIT
jgi:hypothetical protein